MKPSVLLTTRMPSAVMQLLEESGEFDLQEGSDLTEDELVARLHGKQGVLSVFTNQMTRRVIESATALKVIANVGVGYNNIDVLTEATANLTWALILDCTRRVTEGDRLVRRGGWKGWTFNFMLGSEIAGKQLGVVGWGRIGRAVARRALAFDMRVACYSPRAAAGPASSSAGRVSEDAAKTTEFMPLDRLLATSDIVTLHCPLTAETRHLIDQTALARMKRSAYLINAARGPVVSSRSRTWSWRPTSEVRRWRRALPWRIWRRVTPSR